MEGSDNKVLSVSVSGMVLAEDEFKKGNIHTNTNTNKKTKQKGNKIINGK